MSFKIVTVVGARPQFIKAAAVSREIAKHPEFEEVIIHTGQHFDKEMSSVFFDEMRIPEPRYNLNINSLKHGSMTGRMLEKIEEALIFEQPRAVLVYGDTNSTLAGALAAKKLHLKVVHVEAGLRSFNMLMPEEVNRILTDRISDVLCCPTDRAVENLLIEGFNHYPCNVVKTGDVMQDAALFYGKISSEKSRIIEKLRVSDVEFLLCTLHRAENTDDLKRLSSIVKALNKISKEYVVILPLHPRTAKILRSNDIELDATITPPLGYLDMIELLKKTKLVLTDSGGLQKEAFFFSKPTVTLRDETEWVELVDNGFNVLAGADADKIISCCRQMLETKFDAHDKCLYGNGEASKNVVLAIKHIA